MILRDRVNEKSFLHIWWNESFCFPFCLMHYGILTSFIIDERRVQYITTDRQHAVL
jgi:hypothetical protein